ncbi:MAG: extensin-like domain-containing protein [Paracoccaceae bacterium]
MFRFALITILGLMTVSGVATAKNLAQPVQPMARPVTPDEIRPEFAVFLTNAPGLKLSLRPQVRPVATVRIVPKPVRVVQVASTVSLRRSLRPLVRPENLRRKNTVVAAGFVKITPAPKTTRIKKTKKGSICGSRTIRGQKISPIAGRLKGCGISDPVRVTSVDGVMLSQASTMDCTTANALETWVKQGVKPAVGRLGGGVSSLKVVAHYSCRTRNSQTGAKISEHGKGHAIDIAAINLKNGVSLTVLKGWRDPVQSKVMKAMHKSACGPFGTVLGPKSDKFHQDHFHLDTARYRSGSYCR